MNSSTLTLGLVSVMFVGLVVSIGMQWRTNHLLWWEIASLHEHLGTRKGPADTGGPTKGRELAETFRSAQQVEMIRLREEVSGLRARTASLARLAVRSAEAAPPLNLMPAGPWKNAGRATSSAAAETMMWAADSGDVDALASAITLDPTAREKAEAILTRMSDATRAQYNSPEKLVALLLAREGDIQTMQVLGENQSGDDALVNLRLQKTDGKTKEEGMQFRRSSDGWRMTVNGKAMDKMGKKLTEAPKK